MDDLDKRIIEAYDVVITESNNYVKYFTKDSIAFQKQFKKHIDALSRDWLPNALEAFDKVITAVEDQGNVDMSGVTAGLDQLKSSLNDIIEDTDTLFKALNLRHINALARQWRADIEKDYSRYIKRF